MLVMAVADDSRPDDEEVVLIVLLSLVRAGRDSRRSVVGRRWMPYSYVLSREDCW